MDILNLHFSRFDFDKPEQTKAVIEHFLLAETELSSDQTADLADLIFLAWQQGYSAGYAQGTDAALGWDDDYEEY